MTGTTASTITALTAHCAWATRPPDERYASVHVLYEAARARRLGTVERRIATGALGTMAVTDDELALRDPVGGTAPLTHWSFEQLATIAGAPPKYLRSLPASIASVAINHGMSRQGRAQHQLFVDAAAPGTVRAITSPRYTRVQNDELAGRVLDLHDHLIGGEAGQYFSFREAGLLGTGLEEIVAACGAHPTRARPSGCL
jgi:hypothetical protein